MQAAMQRMEGLMRKAMQAYHMVEAGDKICVGVSGGKDSVLLTLALHNLAKYYEVPYTVHAVTLDPCFGGKETNYAPIEALFAQHGIPYEIRRTDIGGIVFGDMPQQNPCSLCAKLRRGALHTAAQELGCNRVALGHHMDDAVETFYMNLMEGGRIGCFSPVTWLSRRQLYLIRPMALASEQAVIRAVRAAGLPVVKNPCPVDGDTQRAVYKAFVAERSKTDPAFRQKTLGAMQKAGIDGWAPLESGIHRSIKKDGSTHEEAAGCN